MSKIPPDVFQPMPFSWHLKRIFLCSWRGHKPVRYGLNFQVCWHCGTLIVDSPTADMNVNTTLISHAPHCPSVMEPENPNAPCTCDFAKHGSEEIPERDRQFKVPDVGPLGYIPPKIEKKEPDAPFGLDTGDSIEFRETAWPLVERNSG